MLPWGVSPTLWRTNAVAVSVALSFALASLSTGTALAAAPGVSLGTAGSAHFLFKKKRRKRKKKPRGLSTQSAEAKRQAIRDAVAVDREAGDWAAVADVLEDNAAQLGDPVTMMEAGEARLTAADEQRSIDEAKRSIATTQVALDMLHFYDAVSEVQASSTWLVIDPATAAGMIPAGEEQIEAAENLIASIEAEADKSDLVAVGEDDEPKKKRGPAKPGTVLIISGAALVTLGVSGAGLGVAGLMISKGKQDEVEKITDPLAQMEEVNQLDKDGKRANTLGWVGLGVAAVGLGVGIPLIVIGAKKRKSAGPSAAATLKVAPSLTRTQSGLVLSGRF